MSLHSHNDKTIAVYSLRVEDYISKTPQEYQSNHLPLLRWLNFSLGQIPKNGKILEVGSGNGREALYIQSKGYHIHASDAVSGFVAHLRQIGLKEVSCINVLKDQLPAHEYNLILANAVLPHFTLSDVKQTLRSVAKALLPQGIFAFSLKEGEGEGWVNEKFHEKRYIHFWQPEEIKILCESLGYEVIFLEDGIRGDTAAHTWINITIRKSG